MSDPQLLEHLRALVACDTQNPPRAIDGDSPVFAYCRDTVGSGFDIQVRDHGDGHVSWIKRKNIDGLDLMWNPDRWPAGRISLGDTFYYGSPITGDNPL